MNRRDLIKYAGGAVASLAVPSNSFAESRQPSGASAPPQRPNVLFICSDQHSGSALGVNGHPVVKTPNMDKLAASGTNFQTVYCGSPVCTPSRAGLMTGMYPSDVASYCNSTPFLGQGPTWGTRLRDAGYDTWATGKLDLCEGKDLGFTQFKTVHEHFVSPDVTSLFRSPLCFRAEERGDVNGRFDVGQHKDVAVAADGMDFLRRQKGSQKPWCAWIGLTEPHPPYRARPEYAKIYPAADMPLATWPEGYLERRHPAIQMLASYKDMQLPIAPERQRNARAAYYGMVTELDKLIGQAVAVLEETGQRDNTIIVYTSDHGDMLGEHAIWLKNTLLDNAARVPLIVSGPGVPRGKSVHAPIAHVDFIATLMEICGAKTDGLRGHSLKALMAGDDSKAPAFVYAESHSEGNATGSFMIRQDKWKYMYFTGSDPLLFDMSQPNGEYVNLAGSRQSAPVVAELHAHLASVVDPDAITLAAFRKQAQFLAELVKKQSKAEFNRGVSRRLGPIQGLTFTERLYAQPAWSSPS